MIYLRGIISLQSLSWLTRLYIQSHLVSQHDCIIEDVEKKDERNWNFS